MKKIILAALCLLFTFVASAQSPDTDSSFVMEGAFLQPVKAAKIYLVYQAEGKKFLDSTAVRNQHFIIRGAAPYPVPATLILDHEGVGFKNVLKKPVDQNDLLKLYLHAGNIRLNISDSVATAVFTSSVINQDYSRLKVMLNPGSEHELYRLSAQMQKSRAPDAENRYVAYHDSVMKARRPVLKRFVRENPSSYIALTSLIAYAGAFPDTHEIKPLFNSLSPAVKNTKTGLDFTTLLNSNVSVGALAPDFTQNDTAGKPVRLSSLRGQFVLIDFWASWCPSCREENPGLVKAWNMLKDKNFTILGVSLDAQDTKMAWLKAIKDDGLNWTQVSDLKHWDNAVIKLYGINAIPQNVLINPEGKVIARNIEPEDLKKQLEQAGK